jgi:hypothetical protein
MFFIVAPLCLLGMVGIFLILARELKRDAKIHEFYNNHPELRGRCRRRGLM